MEMACAHSRESNSNRLLSLTQPADVKELTVTTLKRFRSHDQLVKSTARERLIRRTKSLSTHLILNMDELLNSSFLRQQCPDSGEPTIANKEGEDSCSWENIPLELNLPISLKFQDVKYKVEMKGSIKVLEEGKYILQGVSGSVQPGEVLALIGPSGGGKTTLLNLLSGRVEFNSGTITYNNQPYTKSLRRRIGYVLQDDLVMPHLTVKETLIYAALLRLPNSLTKEQKGERAMNIISELGLERCQNTVVGGGYVRGISGGERKRVCIGNEILLNPSLLFLDEPTSGLDSSTALRIVQMLHAIAKNGKTVVTTIHQPSSRLFSKFDKLILLGKGSSLYFGKASEAMLYFNSIGCSPLIAMNPAEFLIDLANGNMNDKSIPSELESKRIVTDTKPSPVQVQEYLAGVCEERAAKLRTEELLKPAIVCSQLEMEMTSHTTRERGATWWEQFCVLSSRGFKERRHEYFSMMRVMQVVATALIIGSLWWRCNSSSPRGLQDQAGLLFFISVFWGFFPLFTAVFTFPQERAMLAKERSVGLYKLSAYFAARNMTDVPLDLILPVLFVLIVYFMVGLKQTFPAFSLTMLTVFFSIAAAQGLGLSIGAAFMDVKKAMTLASVILMTFMLSGGFFIQKVPLFMAWVRYLSFNYHTYKLLLKIQYSCSEGSSESGSCHPPIIRGLKLDSGVVEVVALAAMVIGYRFLAYFLLRRMKF